MAKFSGQGTSDLEGRDHAVPMHSGNSQIDMNTSYNSAMGKLQDLPSVSGRSGNTNVTGDQGLAGFPNQNTLPTAAADSKTVQ